MIVNVEILEFPEDGERRRRARDRDPGLPRRFRRRRRDHDPQAPHPASVSARGAGAGAAHVAEHHPAPRNSPAAAIFATRISSPSTAKRRAISTTPCGWTACRTATIALQVHIADVSHYVRPGTPIDVEAALRGTSVYFPDRAVPMLPVELSTDICSLRPQVDRLVLSALLEIDHRGDVVSQEFVRGVIRSAERMTYTNVHAAARRRRRTAPSATQPLVPRFELMQELALILNRKRVRRGSIDFDLPEPLIEFDEFGEMTGVTRSPRNIAHRLIEEFMLAANEAVAAHLEHAGIAVASTASTRCPTRSACWSSRRSPRTSAIRSGSAPCR